MLLHVLALVSNARDLRFGPKQPNSPKFTHFSEDRNEPNRSKHLTKLDFFFFAIAKVYISQHIFLGIESSINLNSLLILYVFHFITFDRHRNNVFSLSFSFNSLRISSLLTHNHSWEVLDDKNFHQILTIFHLNCSPLTGQTTKSRSEITHFFEIHPFRW